MKKILIPKNPDETIILPPYVDFRSDIPSREAAIKEAVLKSYKLPYCGGAYKIAFKQSKQTGPK